MNSEEKIQERIQRLRAEDIRLNAHVFVLDNGTYIGLDFPGHQINLNASQPNSDQRHTTSNCHYELFHSEKKVESSIVK